MKKVQIEGIGEVQLKKSSNSKYIKLKVIPFEGVVVTIPTYLNYEFGINAVMGKYEWLMNQMEKTKAKEKELTFKSSQFPLKTFLYNVNVAFHTQTVFGRKAIKSDVYIYIPKNFDFESGEVQNYLRESLNKVYKTEAKIVLTEKVKTYAQQWELKVKKLTIRDTKTLWGSCSHDNSISLNYHLMKLPERLIDYVILHELAHVKEKNHQKSFWNLLNKYCEGKAKVLDKELGTYSHIILV